MAYKDLHDFVKTLESKKLLTRVKAKVSTDLEITEITDRVSKAYGNALLFENVEGSNFPVLINAMGTYERMNLALGVDSLDRIGQDIQDFLKFAQGGNLLEKVKNAPKLTRLASVLPLKIPGKAKCQEVVNMKPNLNELPVLKCWPQDGGKFFTLPLITTKDPETGQQNMGMYRMQIFDDTTTGMHWHLHKDGREIYDKYKKAGISRMPVSVVLGCDPAVTFSAACPLPKMIDEIMFAGFLRKFPVNMVKSVTNDIYVPADAEFIIEGYVDVDEELRLEGPFGDHTGYYSLADYYPAFHVTCITHRKNAIYPTTIVGKPPMEDCYMGKAIERIFLPLIRMQSPDILDMDFPLEGVFHNCVIISIDKKYPGHAKKVMNTVWGTGQMMYTKMVIVVDKHVNPHDYSTVAWKVFNNIDAKRDVVISEGPLDALDHASPLPHYGHRIGIDATKKWAEEGHPRPWPDDIEMSGDIKDLVTRRWKEYGI